MQIDPQDFLNKVYATNFLERIVKDVDLIISPKDIVKLCNYNVGSCHVSLFDSKTLDGLLRSVKNRKGKEVYQKSNIRLGRITPSLVYSVQTFVQADKIIGFSSLSLFLTRYNINGIKEVGPLIIFFYGQREKYVSFYMPPILEIGNSENLEPILSNLEKRLEEEKYIVLPGVSGDVHIDLEFVYRMNLELYKENNGIRFLRDGAHRGYLTMVAGTTIKIIEIYGSEATPTGALLPFENLVITRKKPKRKEDRFLGHYPDSWLSYDELGIDG